MLPEPRLGQVWFAGPEGPRRALTEAEVLRPEPKDAVGGVRWAGVSKGFLVAKGMAKNVFQVLTC